MTEVAELPGQDSRVARLMVEAAELRQQNERLRARVMELGRRLSAVSDGPPPAAGMCVVPVRIGGACVPVEFEHEPEEGDGWNEPLEPELAIASRVAIGGRWVDIDDLAWELEPDRLSRSALAAVEAQRRDAALDTALAAREVA